MTDLTRKGPGDFDPPDEVNYKEWAQEHGEQLARDFVEADCSVPGLVCGLDAVMEQCPEEVTAIARAVLKGGRMDLYYLRKKLEEAMVDAVWEMIEDNAESCYNVWKLKMEPGYD